MKATKDHNDKIAKLSFASVYPCYIKKLEKKGKTKEELNQVIQWLTGFTEIQINKFIEDKISFESFFSMAEINSNAHLIKGLICGYRVEDINNPLTQKVRYLDKLVDNLAKGKKIDAYLSET